MKSKIRKFEPQSVSKVLDEIIQSKALNNGITNARINELWFKLMGNNIFNYTEKISLKGKTLFVSLNNAALREELNYGKERIKKMINDQLGKETIGKVVLC
ncbi:MAG: hypothetical protein CBD72_01920 [Flavobacteriaceae bacterium TMED212]|nr:MAG: hypothetical protein CBD72_01920 [Flavobacteriaceae bacterium TMED212]|tara:strand:+ start:14477 stop:14779 length:303 start_codon:yes stop_codon:yes gene_type:complete